MDNKAELIQSLIDDAVKLQYGDKEKLDELRRRGKLLIQKVFGHSSSYIDDLEKISFSPQVIMGGNVDDILRRTWELHQPKLINLFRTMLEDVQISSDSPDNNAQAKNEEFAKTL